MESSFHIIKKLAESFVHCHMCGHVHLQIVNPIICSQQPNCELCFGFTNHFNMTGWIISCPVCDAAI